MMTQLLSGATRIFRSHCTVGDSIASTENAKQHEVLNPFVIVPLMLSSCHALHHTCNRQSQ